MGLERPLELLGVFKGRCEPVAALKRHLCPWEFVSLRWAYVHTYAVTCVTGFFFFGAQRRAGGPGEGNLPGGTFSSLLFYGPPGPPGLSV